MTSMNSRNRKVLVWDLPVRVFHWVFATAFIVGWVISENDRLLHAHTYAGYVMAGLLVFRLVWGFHGGVYARFNSFIYGPRQAFSYLKSIVTGKPPHYLGHNPAGSWAIYLLLVLTVLLCVTGLIVLGGEEGQGPMKGLISIPLGVFFHDLHMYIAWMMVALVGFHIGGVIIESYVHRENLVRSMLDGLKQGSGRSSKPFISLGISLLLVIIISLPVYFQGYLGASADSPYTPYQQSALPGSELWIEECSDCHSAYHPSLLPARSWETLFKQQNEHFGDDLDLDDSVVAELTTYAIENSAENTMIEAAWKINNSIAGDNVPLRITETPYWEDKHNEITELTWEHKEVRNKGNCAACHLDADAGTFQDSAMRIPR